MIYRLPSFTWLLAGFLVVSEAQALQSAGSSTNAAPVAGAGQGGAPAAAERPAEQAPDPELGQRLIEWSARQLAAETSLETRLRQRVDAFGHELIGAGTYLQFGAGEDRKLRLELKLQVGNQVSTIQQICDGRRLWIRRDFPDGQHLMRIDLRRARETLREQQSPEFDGRSLAAGSAWLEGGGLPGLLESLAFNFQFSPPRQSAPGPGESPQGAAATQWVMEGQWRPERLAALTSGEGTSDKKAAGKATSAAPTPTRVVVMLGVGKQFPFFPARIDFFGKSSAKADQGRAGGLRLLATLEFFDVRRLPHVDPRQFEYLPGDQEVVDGTDAYIARWNRSLAISPPITAPPSP